MNENAQDLRKVTQRRRPPHGPGARMMPGEKAKDFKGTIAKLVRFMGQFKVSLAVAIVFAIFSVIVGPMVYFFPAGLKTFLDSFVMLVGLPVLSGVFGGFFFNCLPKYSARFIMVFHIICYGGFMLLSPSYSLFGGNEGSIHYLYAVSILWPLEMLIMYLMHRRNKSKGAEVWVQQDVGAVDLTPWKYSKLVSVIVIVCVLLVYLAFSPLGIGA